MNTYENVEIFEDTKRLCEKNEKLKASDQLGWISRINNIHQRAEEIILDELVFA